MIKMKVHILQHTHETPPGNVLDWLAARGYHYTSTRFYLDEPLPEVSEVDWLIICGGGMGVHDERQFPWLKTEKRFIEHALAKGATALGLCLGAQLLAEIHGAPVERHCHWEVGWHPVRMEDGRQLTVFQFHQDSFTMPAGSTRIATNEICLNQGFRIGEHIVGLQFHPEATESWVRACAAEDDFPSGPYVQDPQRILQGLAHLAAQRAWFFQFLKRLETVTRF